METVQFYISRSAAEATDLAGEFRTRLAARGTRDQFLVRQHGRGLRVVCGVPTARMLLEELRVLARATSRPELRNDCVRAANIIAKSLLSVRSIARGEGTSDGQWGPLSIQK